MFPCLISTETLVFKLKAKASYLSFLTDIILYGDEKFWPGTEGTSTGGSLYAQSHLSSQQNQALLDSEDV